MQLLQIAKVQNLQTRQVSKINVPDMYVSRGMSSTSYTTPVRVRLMTLPVEPHAMPSQLWQQSEEGVQECSSFEGSEMILLLNSSNASLSTM